VTSEADIRSGALMHWASAVVLIVGLKACCHSTALYLPVESGCLWTPRLASRPSIFCVSDVGAVQEGRKIQQAKLDY
jgi:hypothetical protein